MDTKESGHAQKKIIFAKLREAEVLFLDEMVEFPTRVLEVMRQPLEDKVVTISREQ